MGGKVDDGNLATCIKKHEGGCRGFFLAGEAIKFRSRDFFFAALLCGGTM